VKRIIVKAIQMTPNTMAAMEIFRDDLADATAPFTSPLASAVLDWLDLTMAQMPSGQQQKIQANIARPRLLFTAPG